MSQEPPISIKYEQSLAFAGEEGWQTGRTVFVQLFDSMVSSGLLAQLTGNAFKVLSALGLAASPLGTGSEQAEAFFQDLVRAGIVLPQDRGRLFCCVLHHELMRRTGISKNTLSRCTAELEERGMVEKREVPGEGTKRYNIYFILPASHLDKYNTHRLSSRATNAAAVPKTGTAPGDAIPKTGTARGPDAIPDSGTVPKTGTNSIFPPTTTPTTTAAVTGQMVAGFDRNAVLAHFARRKGVGRYRATAHDEKKLTLLQERGYSQEEILAAIDLAFDSLTPDAPPIRMFSYCATVALATPPRGISPAEGEKNTTAERPRDPASPPPAAASGKPDTPSVLKYVMRLYESEIGPVTPLIEDELRTLVAQYPDPDAWDTAFREAVRANVAQLRYVQQVLKGRATRARSTLPLSGGTDVEQQSQSSRSRAGRNGDDRRRRTASPGQASGTTSDADLEAAQQRAAAMQPKPTHEDETCPTCGGLGWLRLDVPFGHPQFGQLVPCDDCGQVHRQRIARFDRYSSRKGRALKQRFHNFDLNGPAAAATEAYNAALAFTAEPVGWLVIHGPKGNGKSHLAAAVANYLIDERGMAALFLTVPDLLRSLRQEIRDSVQGQGGDSRMLDTAQESPVLILDDLGAERWTEWAEEQLFLLLDYRYRLESPTVVITNEELERLPSRIYSRLGDRALSRVVHNPAPDYRWGDGRVTR